MWHSICVSALIVFNFVMYIALFFSCALQYDGSLLHEAIAAANSNIARMLIDAKADVNARSKVCERVLDLLIFSICFRN